MRFAFILSIHTWDSRVVEMKVIDGKNRWRDTETVWIKIQFLWWSMTRRFKVKAGEWEPLTK